MDKINDADPEVSKTLADQVYQKLRNDIICGELKAGEKLRLSNLCKKYNVGMSPLREALARLNGDALVETEGQRGYWVAPLSIEESEDITRVRILLEGEALQLSIAAGDDEWRDRLTDAFEKLTSVEARLKGRNRNDVAEWEDANWKFHEAMISACGSPWLKRLLRTLFLRFERYRRLVLVNPGEGRDLHEEHRAMYEAAMQGNILKACRLADAHLRETGEVVRRELQVSLTE